MSTWTDEHRMGLLEALLRVRGPRLTLTWNRGAGRDFAEIEDAEDETLAVGESLRDALDELLDQQNDTDANQGSLL